jgi:glycopeptide antibiotics resistance protein
VALLSNAGVGELTETARTRLPMALWIASTVFIVYGTTIPFNFVHDRRLVAAHLARVTWNPFIAADTGGRVSIPDFVSNILLFIPFGFFGMWALPRARSLGARIALVAALGLALTISVESLQLLTIDRTSSVSDVFANASGALGGAVALSFSRPSSKVFCGPSQRRESRRSRRSSRFSSRPSCCSQRSSSRSTSR